MSRTKTARRPPRLYALLLALIAAFLIAGGLRLITLGGSPYYALAGLAVGASAFYFWLGRREGAWLYTAMLVATAAWALWESGFDFWALTARLAAPLVLGLWQLTPGFDRRLGAVGTSAAWRLIRPLGFIGALAVAVIVGFVLHQFQSKLVDPAFTVAQSPPTPASIAPSADVPPAAEDWTTYGGDASGRRYSALTQITPQNVSKLEVAWTYHIGAAPKGMLANLEVNPLKVEDTLYLCSALNDLVALDAETGKERWRHNVNVNIKGVLAGTCRGVAYYRSPKPLAECAERIITNTVDARLIAVDAKTGAPCQSFGKNGQVSLLTGMGHVISGYTMITSAPTIVRGRIVLGGSVMDNQFWGEPSGVIRAFDAVTGEFSWAFDMGRPGEHGEPGPGEHYTRSTPNAWAPMSADETLGLVYAPTGNAPPDYYGAQRRPFDDEYSSSVIALNAETGALRWSFQTTHHDVWDYDVASQPTLIDLPAAGGGVTHALLQPTKRGEIFMLDRVTGKPIATVEERKVSTSGGAPGERLSPTQPFSVGLPSFRGPDLRERMMWGLTPLDQMICRIKFKGARYDGPLTPTGLTPNILYPGFLGGMDWGGVAVDPQRHLMIVNSDRVANYDQLLTRAEANRRGMEPRGEDAEVGVVPTGYAQANTPFAVTPGPFLSPLGAPCQQPPYGLITAVDLKSRQVVWSRILGTARDSGPLGLRSHLPIPMGVPTMGGAVIAASGLIFIAASQERTVRAIDAADGRTLWSARLPAGGQSTPTTYISRASGRQFLVIAAGGSLALRSGQHDAIIAYALPAQN